MACQLRPTNDISVVPLLNPNSSVQNLKNLLNLTGKEQETVILFVDLRDFTKLSETALPYDVVYILNKYYAACGEVIEKNNGRLDKFIEMGLWLFLIKVIVLIPIQEMLFCQQIKFPKNGRVK